MTAVLDAQREATRLAALFRADQPLPTLDQLPIPSDVQPGPGWTEQMLEMAEHIGPFATMCIVARFGGEQVYVAKDPARSPFRAVVPPATAAHIASIYGGNKLLVPVGRVALQRARRAVVVAAARAAIITLADARRIIGTSRTYMSHLVNQTDEGKDGSAVAAARLLPAQGDLFASTKAS